MRGVGLFGLLCCLLLLSPLNMRAQIPYELRLGVDLPLTLGSTGGFGAGFLLQKKVKPLTEQQVIDFTNPKAQKFYGLEAQATRNYSRPSAKLSDALVLTSMATPLLLFLDQKVRTDALPYSVMAYQTLTWNGSFTDITKALTKRTRPYVYNTKKNVPMEKKTERDARFSFFSGHTSYAAAATFFTARVFSEVNPDSKAKGWVWAGAAVLPAVTGLLRVKAGKHFPTDVVTGYAVGALVGILIPQLHKVSNNN